LLHKASGREFTTTLRKQKTANTDGDDKESNNKNNMSSDQDYASFLDKANQDPAKGVASSQQASKKKLRTTQHGVEVPAPLTRVCKDAFYVSDADEPFEPVALEWDEDGKGLPDEGESLFSLFFILPCLCPAWAGFLFFLFPSRYPSVHPDQGANKAG
jgi:hypothetical protein